MHVPIKTVHWQVQLWKSIMGSAGLLQHSEVREVIPWISHFAWSYNNIFALPFIIIITTHISNFCYSPSSFFLFFFKIFVQTFLVPVKLQNSMCLLKQQNLLDVLKCNLRPCYISCATTMGATWVLHFIHDCPRCFPFHYQTLFVRLVVPCFYACFCLALTPQEFKEKFVDFSAHQRPWTKVLLEDLGCTWLGLMWSLIVVMPLSLGFMLHTS